MRRAPSLLGIRRSSRSDDLAGALVSHTPKSISWMTEVQSFDSASLGDIQTNPGPQSYKWFLNRSVSEWKRVDDREAGEDEGLICPGIVHDTHLCKAQSTSHGIVTVKTAGIDAVIDVIVKNKNCISLELWESILSRVEYLSSTLSVKSIRLFLEALSQAKLDELPRAHMQSTIRAVGQELLCRFHSLTLLSCSSIAHSISLIPGARHEGTLNILLLAFKQNIEELDGCVPEDALLSLAVRFLRAFASLDYLLPAVLDATKDVLISLNSRISMEDRLDMIRLIVSTGSDHPYMSTLLPAHGEEFRAATSDQVVQFLQLVACNPTAQLEPVARRVVDLRVNFVDMPAEAVAINGGGTGMITRTAMVSPYVLELIVKLQSDRDQLSC